MQHFADFGYIKQANKQLKRLNDLKLEGNSVVNLQTPEHIQSRLAYNRRNYKRAISGLDPLENQGKAVGAAGFYNNIPKAEIIKNDRGTIYNRGMNRENIVLRKPKSGEKITDREWVMTPDKENYYDVRPTEDLAASSSGYLGFQKDPYKGYGGMMEEPVPLLSTGVKVPKARRPY